MSSRWALPLAGLSLAALSLVACGGDVDDAAPSATSASVTSTTSTTFPGAVTPVSTPPGETRFLKAVRIGAHDGFDRVVFEFESGVPGYAVKYVPRPISEDASGKEVTVAGAAVLSVRFESASGFDTSTGNGRQTYTGPTRLPATGAVVAEVVRTGDFEAVVNWVIGVRREAPFHAYPSEGNKLVIDVSV